MGVYRDRLHRRSAPPGAATRHRWRGRPACGRQACRAWVAEGIRLLPRLRERAAISHPRVGAGCTGDPRRQARQPGAAGAAGPLGRGRRRDSAPTGVPGARRDFPTEGRRRLHRRPAPPGVATRHRWRGRPSRAWVAEGIRLLPGFREYAAISQPRVGAGCTGDPRRQARQARWGLGRWRDSAPIGASSRRGRRAPAPGPARGRRGPS